MGGAALDLLATHDRGWEEFFKSQIDIWGISGLISVKSVHSEGEDIVVKFSRTNDVRKTGRREESGR